MEGFLPDEYDVVSCIPHMISQSENHLMDEVLSREETKRVGFSLNGDNLGGPDGFSGIFYHYWWDIMGGDVERMVRTFYVGLYDLDSLFILIW